MLRTPAKPPDTGRNLFLISTPLQFVMATIISEQLGIISEYLILTDYPQSLRQINRTARLLGSVPYRRLPDKVTHDSPGRFRRLWRESVRFTQILALKRELMAGDRLFISGSESSLHQALLFGRGVHDLAFFDDGSSSIDFLTSRAQGCRQVQFPEPRFPYLYAWLYPGSISLDRVNFYTLYPGLSGCPEDTVLHIRPRLPEMFSRPKDTVPEIWYIGGPLVQAKLISQRRNAELLRELHAVCRELDLKLVYFRHRTEKILQLDTPFEVRVPDLPFELYYGMENCKPIALASVISSALINIKLLWGTEQRLFFIDPEVDCDQSRIAGVQEYAHRFVGVPVLTLAEMGATLKGTRSW